MPTFKDWIAGRSEVTIADADELYVRDDSANDSKRITWSTLKSELVDRSYRDRTRALSPDAYWRMDDDDTTMVDEMGAWNGTHTGTDTWTGLWSPLDGGAGGAVRYPSGGTAYGSVTVSATTDPIVLTASQWTWRGWVRLSSLSSDFYLYRQSSLSNAVGIRLNADSGAMRLQILGNFTTAYQTGPAISETYKWHHIVVVSTDDMSTTDEVKFYVDGAEVPVTAYSAPSAVTGNTSVVQIGSNFTDVVMSEVAILDGVVWTADDAQADFAAANLDFSPTTVDWGTHDDIHYEGTASVRETILRNAAADSSKFSRNTLLWELIEPTDGAVYDWSRSDSIMEDCLTYGIEPMWVVATSPTWANGGADRWAVPALAGDFTAWCAAYASFITDVVARYKNPTDTRAACKKWDLWNEPNLAGFWNGAPDAAEYVEWANAVANAILDEDPEAEVSLAPLVAWFATGGSDIAGSVFLKSILTNATPITDRVNRWSIHPYMDTASDPYIHLTAQNNTGVAMWGYLDMLANYGRLNDDTELWITEIGWNADQCGIPEQAEFTRRGMDMIRRYWSKWVKVGIHFSSFSDATSRLGFGLRGDAPDYPVKPVRDVFYREHLGVPASSLSNGWYDVRTYGAVGDSTTDDTAAFQAAVDAAFDAGGGIVWVPPLASGYYVVNGLNIGRTGKFAAGITFRGGGGGSALRSTTDHCVNLGAPAGVSNCLIEGLSIQCASAGDAAVNIVNMYSSTIMNNYFGIQSTTAHAVLFNDTNMYDTTWIGNHYSGDGIAFSVPIVKIVATSGNFNINTFIGGRVTGSATATAGPLWSMDHTDNSTYMYDIAMRDMNFEIHQHGGIWAGSQNGLVLDNIGFYDSPNGVSWSASAIHVGKSTGLESRFTEIRNCKVAGPTTLAQRGSHYDVFVEGGGQHFATIINSGSANTAVGKLGLGLTRSTVINPACTPANIIQPDNSYIIGGDGMLTTDIFPWFAGAKAPGNRPATTQTGTTYTIDAFDNGSTIRCTNAAQVTVTIPLESANTAILDGYRVTLFAEGAGGVTLSTTGITLTGSSPNKTVAQNEALYLEKIAGDTWLVLGGTSA